MKLKSEERAEIRIGAWLMEHRIEIFCNRKGAAQKILCCDVFSVMGKTEKPDMVAFDGYSYYVLEIKDGEESGLTRQSRKIIKYYRNFLEGKTKYFIGAKEIKPSIFLGATFFSPMGHLFKNEIIVRERSPEEALMKGMPQKEYFKTFSFSRQIWDEWKPYKDKGYIMGVLLSDKLNNGAGNPTIFVQQFNFKKNRWLPPHNFYRIGDLI